MAGPKHKDQRWYAVYTRSKSEKVAFKALTAAGIHAYLPLMKKIRLYNRKRKEVELPLISCYVFVKIDESEYIKVLQSPNVIDFVRFSSEMISIPEEEIEILRRILGEGWEVNVQKDSFAEGDLVEVASGNLTGMKGYIVGNSENRQLLVNFKHLGLGLEISISRDLLTKALS